jgi:hypothetical protein
VQNGAEWALEKLTMVSYPSRFSGLFSTILASRALANFIYEVNSTSCERENKRDEKEIVLLVSHWKLTVIALQNHNSY